ncbi:MAG TPA: hypothetical protein VK923_11455 [Euzebyales bacterium]|nr:hypothetical protein [Euzebyales bacterium]
MSDYTLLPPTDVQAPAEALAWSPAHGFVVDLAELLEARGEGERTLEVTDAPDGHPFGVIADVEGEAPLASLIRVDRMLVDMQRAQRALAERLADIIDRQSGQDTDIAVEVAALKARVLRLEGSD